MGLGLSLVEGSQDNGRDLQDCDDDDKEAVGGKQDPGLLDGPAVTQEGDEEDERARGDQNVCALFDHRGLS